MSENKEIKSLIQLYLSGSTSDVNAIESTLTQIINLPSSLQEILELFDSNDERVLNILFILLENYLKIYGKDQIYQVSQPIINTLLPIFRKFTTKLAISIFKIIENVCIASSDFDIILQTFKTLISENDIFHSSYLALILSENGYLSANDQMDIIKMSIIDENISSNSNSLVLLFLLFKNQENENLDYFVSEYVQLFIQRLQKSIINQNSSDFQDLCQFIDICSDKQYNIFPFHLFYPIIKEILQNNFPNLMKISSFVLLGSLSTIFINDIDENVALEILSISFQVLLELYDDSLDFNNQCIEVSSTLFVNMFEVIKRDLTADFVLNSFENLFSCEIQENHLISVLFIMNIAQTLYPNVFKSFYQKIIEFIIDILKNGSNNAICYCCSLVLSIVHSKQFISELNPKDFSDFILELFIETNNDMFAEVLCEMLPIVIDSNVFEEYLRKLFENYCEEASYCKIICSLLVLDSNSTNLFFDDIFNLISNLISTKNENSMISASLLLISLTKTSVEKLSPYLNDLIEFNHLFLTDDSDWEIIKHGLMLFKAILFCFKESVAEFTQEIFNYLISDIMEQIETNYDVSLTKQIIGIEADVIQSCFSVFNDLIQNQTEILMLIFKFLVSSNDLIMIGCSFGIELIKSSHSQEEVFQNVFVTLFEGFTNGSNDNLECFAKSLSELINIMPENTFQEELKEIFMFSLEQIKKLERLSVTKSNFIDLIEMISKKVSEIEFIAAQLNQTIGQLLSIKGHLFLQLLSKISKFTFIEDEFFKIAISDSITAIISSNSRNLHEQILLLFNSAINKRFDEENIQNFMGCLDIIDNICDQDSDYIVFIAIRLVISYKLQIDSKIIQILLEHIIPKSETMFISSFCAFPLFIFPVSDSISDIFNRSLIQILTYYEPKTLIQRLTPTCVLGLVELFILTFKENIQIDIERQKQLRILIEWYCCKQKFIKSDTSEKLKY